VTVNLIIGDPRSNLLAKGKKDALAERVLSIGVQKGPPIGVQKGPPSSSSVTGMTGALFALVAA
jgi:hypothetical protein